MLKNVYCITGFYSQIIYDHWVFICIKIYRLKNQVSVKATSIKTKQTNNPQNKNPSSENGIGVGESNPQGNRVWHSHNCPSLHWVLALCFSLILDILYCELLSSWLQQGALSSVGWQAEDENLRRIPMCLVLTLPTNSAFFVCGFQMYKPWCCHGHHSKGGREEQVHCVTHCSSQGH